MLSVSYIMELAKSGAASAVCTQGLEKEQLGPGGDGFWIMTPWAVQVASLEKYRSAYTRPVSQRKMLYIAYYRFIFQKCSVLFKISS